MYYLYNLGWVLLMHKADPYLFWWEQAVSTSFHRRFVRVISHMLQASTNNAPLLENGVDGSGNLRNTTVSETSRGSTGSKRPKEAERYGLTSQQAIDLREEWGYNELPTIVLPLWYIFFVQFTGTMPYMLEIACVLALAVQDYTDFAIIFAMLLCNGYLGFHEELKAKESLDELTNKMEQRIAVLRDGNATSVLTRELVPGDVVLLVGGTAVPADVEWLDGDVLSVETAALTGEPLPRKYPSDRYGNLILCGCTVAAGEAYCIIRKTGIHTEIGGSNAEIMKDKATTKVSIFEERVLFAVKIIILLSLFDVFAIFLVQGLVRLEFRDNINELILTCLSIIIAAVPVALPLVLQVTMALGAGKMAREFDSVVTSLPALQDISSMSVLCSDKTGTLTTANISIHNDSVWTTEGYTAKDVALYGALASNRDKKEDPIDRSVINHFDTLFGEEGSRIVDEYSKVRLVGFNPIFKRVVAEFTHPNKGRIVIAKGLPAKVLNTADGGSDDSADQWKVKNLEDLYPLVSERDRKFSEAGYKTLGVSIKINDKEWEFVGILPMLDPPRHDSAQTVKNLQNAGISVKMITGDHLNIGIETGRLIGMGTNMYPGEATRDGTEHTKELIWNADGFAQVLPKDKREVVLCLKNHFKVVVGMTGDGVNDAPALSAAQCGIAVDDATDAAKNAAAIILTCPGLSPIYSAVVESRRIFRKLKAYVIYRFAATIQIVFVLSFLIYASNCAINSLYVILLALFNDITMLPIAYDRQLASKAPETPEVFRMLLLSFVLGAIETGFSLLFAYGAEGTGWFDSHDDQYHLSSCDTTIQAAVWLQMSIAAELLIFSARAPTYMWKSIAPSWALFISVMAGCVVTSLLAGLFSLFGGLRLIDIILIWAYDLVCLIFLDIAKVAFLSAFNESLEVIDESTLVKSSGHPIDTPMNEAGGIDSSSPGVDALVAATRISAHSSRLSLWDKSGRKSFYSNSYSVQTSSLISRGSERSVGGRFRDRVVSGNLTSRQEYGPNARQVTGRTSLAAGDFRPNTPANATWKVSR